MCIWIQDATEGLQNIQEFSLPPVQEDEPLQIQKIENKLKIKNKYYVSKFVQI